MKFNINIYSSVLSIRWILFTLVLSFLPLLQAEEKNTFLTKTIQTTQNLGLQEKDPLKRISLEKWLEVVTFPETELLHSSKTEQFYFAIFQKDEHLIFWHHNLGVNISSAGYQVIDSKGKCLSADNEKFTRAFVEIATKVTTVTSMEKPLKLEHGSEGTIWNKTSVSINGIEQVSGIVFKIDSRHQGPLFVRFTPSFAGLSEKSALLLEVNWNKHSPLAQ